MFWFKKNVRKLLVLALTLSGVGRQGGVEGGGGGVEGGVGRCKRCRDEVWSLLPVQSHVR